MFNVFSRLRTVTTGCRALRHRNAPAATGRAGLAWQSVICGVGRLGLGMTKAGSVRLASEPLPGPRSG